MSTQSQPRTQIYIARGESLGGRVLRRAVSANNLLYQFWEDAQQGISVPCEEGVQKIALLPLLGPISAEENWSHTARVEVARKYLEEAKAAKVARLVIMLEAPEDNVLSQLASTALFTQLSGCAAEGLPLHTVMARPGQLYGAERPEDPAGYVEELLEQFRQAAEKKADSIDLPIKKHASIFLTYAEELAQVAVYALFNDNQKEILLLNGQELTYGDLAKAAARATDYRGQLRFGREKSLPLVKPFNLDVCNVNINQRTSLQASMPFLVKQRARNGRLTVSACVIMRDNEDEIRRCLTSLTAADEIIVVDTGSKDKSVEIAKEFTDNIFFFDWIDDFSAARNFALEKTSGDWIIFLDSDESFSAETANGIKTLCEDYTYPNGPNSLVTRWLNVDLQGNPINDNAEEAVRRIFQSGMHYEGAIHELQILPNGRNPIDISVPRSRALLFHTGYAPERVALKYERNLRLLDKELASGHDIKLADFYRANMAFSVGNWEDARRYAKRATKFSQHQSNLKFNSYRYWYKSCQALHDEKGRREALAAMRRDMPSMPDSWLYEGLELWNAGRTSEGGPLIIKALELIRDFLKNNPTETNEFATDAPVLAEAVAHYYEELAAYCRSLAPSAPSPKIP
mgnify:CR=1 FL=1